MNEWLAFGFNGAWAVSIMLYASTMWEWGHRRLSVLIWMWAATQWYRTFAWLVVALPNRTVRVGNLLEPVAWLLAAIPTVGFWSAYRWMKRAKRRRDRFAQRLTDNGG